jgi:alpha-galactosidase
MRIGPDVAPFWTSLLSRTAQRGLHGIATRHAIRNALTRTPLHRRWWLNDPDCLMVRDRNTRLTADEVRTLATVVAVTDGLPMLSDRPDRLSAARLELLERALALRGGQARVTDLMRADIPELALATASERTIVAVFNFGERTQRKQVDFVRLGLRVPGALQEWWSGALIALREGIADLGPVPPHACRVLVIKTEK